MLCVLIYTKNVTLNFQFIRKVKCFQRKFEKHKKQIEVKYNYTKFHYPEATTDSIYI